MTESLTGTTHKDVVVIYDPERGGDERMLTCQCKKCGNHMNLLLKNLEQFECEKCLEEIPEEKTPTPVTKEIREKKEVYNESSGDVSEVRKNHGKPSRKISPNTPLILNTYTVKLPMTGQATYSVKAQNPEEVAQLLKKQKWGPDVKMVSKRTQITWSGNLADLEIYLEGKKIS